MTLKYWERIPARPTTYNGIQMRSRLEARFAAGCDKLGVEWKYEPQCFASEEGQYLPDFWIDRPGIYEIESQTYVEVKPVLDDVGKDCRRMEIILQSVPNARLIFASPALGSVLLVNEPVVYSQRLWRQTFWTRFEWEEAGESHHYNQIADTEGWSAGGQHPFFSSLDPAVEFDWSW